MPSVKDSTIETVAMPKGIDDDFLDNLIGPVCHIADLRPSNDWPDDLKALVAYARKVKAEYGFEVETFSTSEPVVVRCWRQRRLVL